MPICQRKRFNVRGSTGSCLLFVACCLILLGYVFCGQSEAALECYDCHGTQSGHDIRPEDAAYRNITTGGFKGNHRTHLGEGISSSACAKCHPGSNSYTSRHRDGKIRISAGINNSPSITTYNNITSPWAQTSEPQLGGCNKVNCHFESITPPWASARLTVPGGGCSACHGAAPADGSHAKHFTAISSASGRAPANFCIKCHADHTSEANSFAHATSAGKRGLILQFTATPNDGGSYSGTTTYPNYLPSQSPPRNGTCNDIYCHSNGAPMGKANVNATPTWGGTLSCSSCHDGSGVATGLSGLHGKHAGGYPFTCERCHNSTATGSDAIKDKSLHVNKEKDIAFKDGGTYVSATKDCTNTYCHGDGRGGAQQKTIKWSDTENTMKCYSCHRGQTTDSTFANCNEIFGVWSTASTKCSPDLSMASDGHHRLVGPQWIRKYPCYYCHAATVDTSGNILDKVKHVNGAKDVVIASRWNIGSRPPASYVAATKTCIDVYCHSDGTTDPEDIRPVAWTEKTECNSCHGHPSGSCSNLNCHDGRVDSVTGKLWPLVTGWPVGKEWMGSLPMFPNQGPLSARPNSHARHAETDFTCDQCHAKTIKGDCASCHQAGIPPGGMGEVSHIDAFFHVNKAKDVNFKNVEASYDPDTRICSNTLCHPTGANPVWGDTVNSVTCLSCHGTTGGDVDDYNAFNGTQGRINKTQWETTGHGRGIYGSFTSAYPVSNNPAANFPGNPCWYCHDNNVLHKDKANIYRLKMHSQYERRFEKECVYCHMTWTNVECLACHVNQTESLSPQATSGGIVFTFKNTSTETKYTDHTYVVNCINGAGCHDSDGGKFANGKPKGHNTNSGSWTPEMKNDVKNQYLQMGVCLQCHDDDSSNQCTSCHVAPENNPLKYSLGYDPGTGFIKPKKARASAGHFGYKHYRAFTDSGGWQKKYTSAKSPNFGTYSVAKGTWKGGKFCWDCHDPHGDSNVFMIQKKVATETDGWFGIPKSNKQKDVVFLGVGGADYVKKTGTIDGVCNVCHSPASKHYTATSGDGHNYTRRCTTCHEHRFADSHANKQDCTACHESSKPIPKHTAFGLPRDCTKCHTGTVGRRMDVMGQMKSNSHHVQGVEVNNKHCYACHWEATPDGLIDNLRHTGYNYKNYSSVKDDVVDLVIWQANGVRPTFYSSTSATTFMAKNMAVDGDLQRAEVSKVSNHCLSCHSEQNDDADPFNDCKTPRQYAWDLKSVGARYSQTGTTKWGKYVGTTNAAKKDISKSFSAHGNAIANGGGWNATTGLDGVITDTRGGTSNRNVQCFDCHNSHGSKVVGTTSSYATFNGTYNGANLKETKKEMGGYANDYKASANSSGVNPYGAGAGQCFDCHNTATSGAVTPNGKTPWGYTSTFGASAAIMGYKDTPKFMNPTQTSEIKASTARFAERDIMKTIVGGHLKASKPGTSLDNLAKYAGSASSGSLTTLVDAGATGWTIAPSKWLNFYLLMGSGSNNGQIRKITANTTTTITVESPGFSYAVVSGDSYKIVPYSATTNTLCCGCHDPHGVSPTIANQDYAVPLLKGTWMTSPYKEDAPPVDPTSTNAQVGAYPPRKRSWGAYQSSPSTPPTTKYSLDRTTFTGSQRISEKDDKFAGLCTNCHKKEMLSDGTVRQKNFRTSQRIHESVKGWGANLEHSFTCSKCHQTHNSGLPRLMQTDCLDYGHRGGRASTGEYMRTTMQSGSATGHGQYRGYPNGNNLGNSATYEASIACHGSAPNNPGTWPTKNYWNDVTRW